MSGFTPKGRRPSPPYLRQRPGPSSSWLVFEGDDRAVFVHSGVLVAVRAWARLGDPEERLGLLAGRGCEDGAGPFTLVVGAVLAARAVGSRAHVAADIGAMQRARQALLASYPVAEVAGWWHTHPGFGTTFSSTDRETQATYRAPHLVGLVVDPRIEGASGFGLYAGPECARLHTESGASFAGPAAGVSLPGAS